MSFDIRLLSRKIYHFYRVSHIFAHAAGSHHPFEHPNFACMFNILLTSLLFHPKTDVCILITPARIQSVSTLSAQESLNSSSSPSSWRGLETPGASCRLMPLRNVSSASAAWLHISGEGSPRWQDSLRWLDSPIVR